MLRYPVILLLIATFITGCQNNQLYTDSRVMLGTILEVKSPDKRAADIVFNEINRIENLLSKYKPGSEVYRLNQRGKLKVSPETFYIIKKSKELSTTTDRAFDITVAPLVDLWGFSDKKYRVPSDQEIKKALKLVGSDKIILHEQDNVIEFSLPGMKIDLGGIAKGYALDCAVKRLKENNIASCLIAAGQVYALGDKLGSPWKIAIKNPRGSVFSGYLEIKNESVATSGDYEQYFEADNIRYSHIMDPRSGYPADSGISSVTVVAPDGLTADALSTAVFVLGKGAEKDLRSAFPGTRIKIQCKTK